LTKIRRELKSLKSKSVSKEKALLKQLIQGSLVTRDNLRELEEWHPLLEA
jgi:hypothetical protein